MSVRCVIPSCHVTFKTHPGEKFILFPKFGTKMYEIWIEKTKLTLKKGTYVICRNHFTPQCFDLNGEAKKFCVPTLNLGNGNKLQLQSLEKTQKSLKVNTDTSNKANPHTKTINSKEKNTKISTISQDKTTTTVEFLDVERIYVNKRLPLNNKTISNSESINEKLINNTKKPVFNFINLTSCLICLQKEGTISIFEEKSPISVVAMIKSFADITITESDGLPKSICSDCSTRVTDAYKLKKQCQDSIKTFHMINDMNEKKKNQTNKVLSTKLTNVQIINNSSKIKNLIDNSQESNNTIDLTDGSQEQDDSLKNDSEELIAELTNDNSRDNLDKIDSDNDSDYIPEEPKIKIVKKENDSDYIPEEPKVKIVKKEKQPRRIADNVTETNRPYNHYYHCELCDKYFKLKQTYEDHNLMHSKLKPFECDLCDKTYKEKRHLADHKRGHASITKSKYLCEVCSGLYSTLSQLETHKLYHEPPKFQCHKCLKMLYSSGSLSVHLKKHDGIRYPCDKCDKTFVCTSGLKLHIKSVHIGLKRFTCVVCSKQFGYSYNYKQHLLSHTGEKPHLCQLCKRNFVSGKQLQLHMELHKDPNANINSLYQCHICSKELSCAKSLRKHIHTHTGEKRVDCTICKRVLANPRSLRNHMKIHNKDYRALRSKAKIGLDKQNEKYIEYEYDNENDNEIKIESENDTLNEFHIHKIEYDENEYDENEYENEILEEEYGDEEDEFEVGSKISIEEIEYIDEIQKNDSDITMEEDQNKFEETELIEYIDDRMNKQVKFEDIDVIY